MLSRVRLFATPQAVAYQAPLSMGFSRQEWILEWGAISSSRGSSRPRDRTWVSHIADRCFTIWASREAPYSHVYSGWISSRIVWFDFCAKGLASIFSRIKHLQSESINSSALSLLLWSSSHPHMTTGKTIVFTLWTFVDKVMFLLFICCPGLSIVLLPRCKGLLISWLQLQSAVILEFSDFGIKLLKPVISV